MSSLGLVMTFWIVSSVATDFIERVRPRAVAGGSVLQRVRMLPRAMVGMMLAHLGVAAFVFGVTMVKSYELERDVKMNVGDTTTAQGYTFTFRGVRDAPGPNYTAAQGLIDVTRDGKLVAQMRPEKRIYRVQTNPMTEAAINPGLTRDLYVSLGEPIEGSTAWIVRVYIKPFIDWIWGGCLLMAFGGFLAVTDKRYRVKSTQRESASGAAGAAA
jgi:cytochrome c-type biogenesis protein CcmF